MTWQRPSDGDPERTSDDRQDPYGRDPGGTDPNSPGPPPPEGTPPEPPSAQPPPPEYQPPPPEYQPPGPLGYPPPGAASYPPPGAGFPPGAPGYGGYPMPARRTNGLAIAAIVCSVGGVFTGISAPVGAVLGHMATKQIAQTGEEGEGLAKAAIIIGWVITGLIVLACCIGVIAVFVAAGRVR